MQHLRRRRLPHAPCSAGSNAHATPVGKATLYSLGGDTVALLHNPDPKVRNPLSLWVSFDGMQTWPYRRDLVTVPGRLNYPDGFVSRDRKYLHFAYDDNRSRAVYYGARLPSK